MGYAFREYEDWAGELCPCPFCGAAPEWVETAGNDFVMRCTACHASTKSISPGPEEAALAWNAGEVEADSYGIAMDKPLEEYLAGGVANVFLEEWFDEGFPQSEKGFLCGDCVVAAQNGRTFAVEAAGEELLYDEVFEYTPDGSEKPLAREGERLRFLRSEGEGMKLTALVFEQGERIFALRAAGGQNGLLVEERQA
ncbi:MAG: Lar family restriction alleviation protein [Oscillospiraceae bacterium]|nr:Lar family restriction alleviation protein [Oscillospiraceae bacterium]